jgi:hypothetical protein
LVSSRSWVIVNYAVSVLIIFMVIVREHKLLSFAGWIHASLTKVLFAREIDLPLGGNAAPLAKSFLGTPRTARG